MIEIEKPAICSSYNNTSLHSLSDLEQFPNLRTIGNYAFAGRAGLESANLPQATSIGAYAFLGWGSVDEFWSEDGGSGYNLSYLGENTLTSIDLPQATSIGNYAFSGCTCLSSLALTSPDEITLTNSSLADYSETLTLDKVTLTLHQNKSLGGSSSPLCTSATEWGGKTWKEIRFVQ